MILDFEQPLLLGLLAAVPLVVFILRFTLVDSPRTQLALSALTRSLILLLLAGALASALWVTRTKALSLMVLGDLSDSVAQSAPGQITNLWRGLQTNQNKQIKAGLVTFATEPKTVVPLGNKGEGPVNLAKPTNASETSIERALVITWETMPADSVKRVVLLSDGNETSGNALEGAKRGARHGFKVFTVPYQIEQKDEALLEDLIVPSEVKKGQSFAVSAVAHSTKETPATFTLYRDGFRVQEKKIDLKPGPNTLTFQESKANEGLTKYELRMKAEKDFFADNNVSAGIVHVAGEPKVLLLEGSEKEARYLARALEAEHIKVEVREGKGMPGSLDEMAAFDAIILSDVPATDLTVRQMNFLRTYVEDLGGGFLMIGGEQSFGLGGFYRTSIEDALPVRMRSEKKKDTPSLALMLVIDKSGSMSGQKVDVAKEAAIAAVELLSERDLVGVIAFDGDPYTVVDLQSAANKMGIVQNIEHIEAGGGTSMYPPLEQAQQALAHITATFKHVIVLTDGVSQPGDFQGIVGQMANEQMTLSAVAVGEDCDFELLQNMARWGKGRYYATTDPSDIPQIFTKETMTAAKSSLVEEPFLPKVLKEDQVVRSIDWQNAPFLFGYVITTAKPTAQVPLISERGDPLLASWRFGLGKSAAFTSDAKSRWAADWLRWPGYAQFWAQVIRDIMRTSQSRGVETTLVLKGDEGSLTIDATTEAGEFVNGLRSQAQIIKPDLSIQTIALPQTAPGRYEAKFPLNDMGSYLFKIRQSRGDETNGSSEVFSDFTRALTISYKPEYRHLSVNEKYLKEIARVTGGSYSPNVQDLLRVEENDAVPVRRKLWPWLLGAALVLFVLDVALRRLDLAGYRIFSSTPQRYG